MKSRIGCFFQLIGLLLAIAFLSSQLAGEPNYGLFFLALFLLVIGMIARRNRERKESERFRGIRSLSRLFKRKDKEAAQTRK